jgi:hypothetical protein
LIGDRQVIPVDPEPLDRLAHIRHLEAVEFSILHQADNGTGAPIGDGTQIGIKVPIPRASHCVGLLLAGTESQSKCSAFAQLELVDKQRV